MAISLVWAVIPSAACGDAPPSTDRTADATPKTAASVGMVGLLKQTAAKIDFRDYSFDNKRRSEYYRDLLKTADGPKLELIYRYYWARQLLFDGQAEAAAREFARLQVVARQNTHLVGPAFHQRVRSYLAVSYLRLGEQENCIGEHSRESCIFPIKGHGVHRKTRGSLQAVALYKEMLEANPDDLDARWLLNLGHMTLGTYPDGVPARWLIPPSTFSSHHDVKRFPEIAMDVGLDVMGLAGGSLVEDFDGDGFLDVMCSSFGLLDPLRFFHNNGDGSFTERTDPAGLTGLVGGLNLVSGDYNNDGCVDVFVPRGAWLLGQGDHPNSLLRNNGDGTFTDVTERAGVLSFHPTQTAAWGDFDNDGWLDLFVGNESGVPKGAEAWLSDADVGRAKPHTCELYRNNGDGTFSECAADVGLAVNAFVKGVVWGDVDNDGRLDLYLSILGQRNILFRNTGPGAKDAGAGSVSWSFQDVTKSAGVSEPIPSFAVWFWDYDNDGWLDLFVAGYSGQSVGDVAAAYLGLANQVERPRLYRNGGGGRFVDVTGSVGLDVAALTMGAGFGDLDNDGYCDFYLGTGDPRYTMLVPNRMFRNDAGKRFQDVTTSGGFGHLQKGHGVSFADIDNDGDQDIYSVIGGAYSGDGAYNVLF